jgi:hypothetical protein
LQGYLFGSPQEFDRAPWAAELNAMLAPAPAGRN